MKGYVRKGYLGLKKIAFKILQYSLNSACKEQGLLEMRSKLAQIVPDLTDQYTSVKVGGDYQISKVRSLHSFQISLAREALSLLDGEKRQNPTIVDIGDSSGTHLQYLQSLAEGVNIRTLSVNIDPVAVKKVRGKGFEVIESRAELLHEHPDFNGNATIFLSFETIEHLLDPVSFLHAMSTKSVCDYFVVTVPYLYRSRVGLNHVRNQNDKRPFNAETTHIFELSPDDWDLLFRFSGWRIVKSIRYTQYPKKNPITLLRYLWRWFDFDGFYGVILQKDDSISKQYQDW
ncbi:MAG: hypothetical protein HOB18_04565 [Nitrospina sp.]|nr:hypothetical protein [Nitrospina sp.]MBT7196279.1 hypothetical protein [Nitrospina sp.]